MRGKSENTRNFEFKNQESKLKKRFYQWWARISKRLCFKKSFHHEIQRNLGINWYLISEASNSDIEGQTLFRIADEYILVQFWLSKCSK